MGEITYTIKISDSSPQATSIINMLRALAQDYDFLQIIEDPPTLTPDQEKELNRRLEYLNKNPAVGKTWEEFEKDLNK